MRQAREGLTIQTQSDECRRGQKGRQLRHPMLGESKVVPTAMTLPLLSQMRIPGMNYLWCLLLTQPYANLH